MEFRPSGLPQFNSSADQMMLYGNYMKNEGGDGVNYDLSSGNEFIPVQHYDQMGGVEFELCTEYTESHTILTDNCSQHGVTAVAFDLHEELLWIGKERGYVASYYGPDMQKHSAFRVHNSEEVRCISSVDCGILALTASSLRCQLRRGLPIFTHSSDNLNEMQCFLPLSHQARDSILMGGHQHKLVEFNLARGEEVNLIDLKESSCAILRQHGNRYVCCGDPSGVIQLRDPLSLKVEHSLEAHTGSLSDFDIHGNLLVTCGFSSRQGGLVVDRLLMVFDIRMMRSVSPIPVLLDPLLLRFMPSFSSRLAVVSSLGQLQLVDTVPLSEPEVSLFQVNATDSLCLSFDVSTSCQVIAIGDSAASLHVFTSKQTPIINTLSRPTEFADPVETYPPINVTDELAVLAAIPLVYPVPAPLVSDWPSQFVKKTHRHHPPIDPEIIRTMKMQGTIGYAPNPHSKRRNQVPYTQDFKSAHRNGNPMDQNPSLKEGDANSAPVFVAIPKRYRKLDMKYWKSGPEDFDFEQFNKTHFSGLEATLPNSYCNAMIQVLYFSEQLRQIVLSHVCQAEFCLCCELGFLFHMLTLSTGYPCHSGNFLRALRNAHEASALNLILPDQNNLELKKKTNLVTLIQNWNRFILHQLHFELLEWKKRKAKESEKRAEFVYRDTDFPSIDLQSRIANKRVKNKVDQQGDSLEAVSVKDEETEVSRLFGSKQLHVHRCLKCQHSISRESNLLVCNLIYPENVAENTEYTFCEVLKQSLCPEQTTPAWCDQCERFQPTLQSRQLKALPTLLTINCNIESSADKAFWQSQMDVLVKKALDSNPVSDIGPNSLNPPIVSSTKPCRYGQNCTRPGCRFKHPGRATETTTAQNSSNPYSTNSWLPLHVHLQLLSSGEVLISKLERSEVNSVASAPKKDDVSLSVVYNLSAVVCHVNDEKKNLVAIINTDYENENWHVFNDVSITPVTAQEAVWFSLDWKIPCVLYWSKHKVKSEEPPPAPPAITSQVFCEDVCLAQNNRSGITFVPLTAEETPKSGEIVAMDAEFVTLNQEEAEIRSDGKLSTVKPSHMSVARVSVIRGQGVLAGTPFIDDYISTQEQVVDYLTKFSGIQPGDLNAASSSKHLTTLKSTYLKLRYLVDNGVKFVGHGLNNDFRVINLVVPPEQVIDTVNLFHLPHQRMVSLRFLAWHFLGLKIQAETHDSIEDAKAALQLYQLYLKFSEEGVVQTHLEEMYKEGKSCQWKVPNVDE